MADDMAPLASFSLTHIYYDPTDPISHACAWLALVPQCLCVVYATLVVATRELEVGLMFAGQLACEAANFALKRLIKEQRPDGGRFRGKGYGMPSSHAQFAFFWAVAVVLFVMVRHRPGGSAGRGGGHQAPAATAMAHSPAMRVLASVGAVTLAAAVAWSRVYLGYHTGRQVLVGACAGTVCAGAWFVAVSALRATNVTGRVLALPLARWLRVRDLLVREDLCQAGWEKWEAGRIAAERTKGR